jgi:hypothetical protein
LNHARLPEVLPKPKQLIAEKRKQEYAKIAISSMNFAAGHRSKTLRKTEMRLAAPDEIVRKMRQNSPDVPQLKLS